MMENLRRAQRARRAIRKAVPKMKFTGEKPSAMLYLGVAMVALLKDLLDFVGVGSLPGVGTVVTICFTFLIWILLTIFDHSGGKKDTKLARGFVVLIFGLVEAIGFGLNFFPIETAMVIVVYFMARRAWKKAKEEADKEGSISQSQQQREHWEEARQARAEEQEAQQEAAVSQTAREQQGAESGGETSPTAEVSRAVRQQLKSPTETWLRDRYEKPYRDEQARRFVVYRAQGADRVDLREKIRTVNLESRVGIQNTARAFDSGELDVKNLATKNNAVVVHAIPLDGWAMKNTSENNQMVAVDSMSAKEKVATIIEKRPDLSVSVIGADTTVPNQEMFYPFGFVVDGKLIATYENDAGAYADGDARRRKEQYSGTLQVDPAQRFAQMSHSPTLKSNYGHNESIVHKPELKAILIDTNTILKHESMGGTGGYTGDEITETFSPDKEAGILAKYGADIVSTVRGMPKSGPYAGKEVFRIKRKRTGVQKALEFAETNYPELPVYLRKSDGIYSLSGEKVTAEQIYSTQKMDDVRKAA